MSYILAHKFDNNIYFIKILNKYKFDETICKTAIRHNNSMIIHVKEFYKSKGLKW